MVFENVMMRRTFGYKRKEVIGEWRKSHNEINNLYTSTNIIRVTKTKKMKWAGYVARMGMINV
jgi:hypothetical protein